MAEYSMAQLSQILSQAHAYIQDEFTMANGQGDLDAFMEKYDISLRESAPQMVTREMKILVVGDLRGRQNDFIVTAKEFGLREKNLEFIDFNQIKNYNIAQLHYSNKYSDIICGPMPHKIKGIRKSKSLISQLENAIDKETYPKLIKATSEQRKGSLKLTKSSFTKALLETRLIKELQYRNYVA